MEPSDRSHDVIAELVRLHARQPLIVVADEHQWQTVVAYGWWTRIVRSARAIALLHEAGLAHEASPIVRTVLHHAMALKWLLLDPEGVLPALDYEHWKETGSMQTRAEHLGWEVGNPTQPNPAPTKPEGYKYLKKLSDLCDLVGHPNAYLVYQSESKYVHPTWLSASAYVDSVSSELLNRSTSGTSLRAVVVFATGATADVASHLGIDDLRRRAFELAAEVGVDLDSG